MHDRRHAVDAANPNPKWIGWINVFVCGFVFALVIGWLAGG